ncbi:hypothetical protein WUBG_10561, partial [Wuchereria bancrofti]
GRNIGVDRIWSWNKECKKMRRISSPGATISSQIEHNKSCGTTSQYVQIDYHFVFSLR